MKNAFVLSVLATATMACCAQSGVTIYGIVDGGATRVSGLKGGALKQLSSGIMEGTRVGFRGNEELGGGYRAIFTAESRIELDNGGVTNRPASGLQLPDRMSQAALMGLPGGLQGAVTLVANGIGSQSVGVNLAGNFFDRQIYVGLVTPFGAVLAGRQYTPAYELSATFDALGTQSGLAFGQVGAIPAAVDIRASNALAYRIQQGGFSASAMAAAGEGSASTGHLLGAMAMYKGDMFAIGAAYNQRENEKGAKSLTSAVLGASLNLGPGTLFAEYIKAKDDNPSGLSTIAATVAAGPGGTPAIGALVQNAFVNAFKQDLNAVHVGYRLTLGVNTVYLAYNRANDKRPNNADTSSYGVAYSYALSKRTDINAVAVRFINSGLGQAAPGGNGYLGGVTASAGVDSTGLALGMRHRF